MRGGAWGGGGMRGGAWGGGGMRGGMGRGRDEGWEMGWGLSFHVWQSIRKIAPNQTKCNSRFHEAH